jgi:hypothetical protein
VNIKKALNDRWKNLGKIKVVEVLWRDASSVTGDEWATSEEVVNAEPALTVSVGYLWVDKPTHVCLVGMLNDHHLGYALTIPRGMIDSIRVLR